MSFFQKNRFIQNLVRGIGRNRAQRLVARFEPFLAKRERVLDIGAGGGWNGERIYQEKNSDITLLDIMNLNQTDLPLTLYDGKNIPFPADSFDVSLLLFVLHHCQDPDAVLKEAVRVTRKRIIVLEDTFATTPERFMLCLYDTFANSPALFVESCGMNLPYKFRRSGDWDRVFQNLGLKVVHTQPIQRFPIAQTLFVLEK